jgi:outer membrane protein OmpA-like peptidoglycan-associated protein
MKKLLTLAIVATLGIAATASATELDPDRPLAPAFSGDTGVIRVYSARTGVVGYWDIGGHSLYFQQKGFTKTDTGAQDYNEFAGAIGSISWAPFTWLEFSGASIIRENYNSTETPKEDTANGAITAGLKLSAPLTGATGPLWVAVKAGTQTPPNVDKIQLRGDTFGFFGAGIITTDFTERGFPFRMHLNGGYVVDHSAKLIVPGQSAARTFALDLSNRNRVTYGGAMELPFKYATPFVEVWGAKPTDVSLSDSPGYFTPGIRVTPVDGLALDLAFDMGISGTKKAINGSATSNPLTGPLPIVPITPQRQLILGASYSFASTKVHERQFQEQGELPEAARRRIAALEAELDAERESSKDAWAELDALEAKVKELAARLKDLGDSNGGAAGDAAMRAVGAARRAHTASGKCSLDDAQAAAAEAEQAAQEAEKSAVATKESGNSESSAKAAEVAALARRVAELTRKAVASAVAALTGPEMQKAWQAARDEAAKGEEYRRKLGNLGSGAAPTADATGATDTSVTKASEFALKADLCNAEPAVVDAEKQAALASAAAQAARKNPDGQNLVRPTEVTAAQAKKTAAAARAALEKARLIVLRLAGAGAGVDTAFRGIVLDGVSFSPLGDAIVSFPDTNLSRLLADTSSGFFRSFPFPPGAVNVSIAKPGYETLLQSVTIRAGSEDVIRFLLKKEGAVANSAPGLFKGRILDEKNGTVAGTLVFADAPFQTKEIETNGAFSLKMPPGLYQVDVKATGYLLQGRRVSVGPGETVTYDFILRPVPKERRAETTGSKITLKDVINFGFNSDVIDKSSFSILDEVADIILNHPEYSLIRIEGHTDDVGSAAYNLSLSDRRARSVANYLLGKGVTPERMQPVGWGKAKPVAEGTDDAARALNRRVEFNVLQQ